MRAPAIPKRDWNYFHYQTTHERAFHKSLNTPIKLRTEKRKSEVGFASQKAEQSREFKRAEFHEACIRLANAKA